MAGPMESPEISHLKHGLATVVEAKRSLQGPPVRISPCIRKMSTTEREDTGWRERPRFELLRVP